MRVKTNNKGFTLVELIVVITIIAILATVAVIGYNTFIDRANLTSDQSELSQMNNLLELHMIDENLDDIDIHAVYQLLVVDNGMSLATKSKHHTYWFNRRTNKLVLAKTTDIIENGQVKLSSSSVDFERDDVGAIAQDEAYVLIDQSNKKLVKAVNGIRNLGNTSIDSEDLQNNFDKFIEGFDGVILSRLQEFSPAQTLYISDSNMLSSSSNSVSKVIFSLGIKSIPRNRTNVVEVAQEKIALPSSVLFVSSGAFSNITTETIIDVPNNRVVFAEGSLSDQMKSVNQITERKLSDFPSFDISWKYDENGKKMEYPNDDLWYLMPTPSINLNNQAYSAVFYGEQESNHYVINGVLFNELGQIVAANNSNGFITDIHYNFELSTIDQIYEITVFNPLVNLKNGNRINSYNEDNIEIYLKLIYNGTTYYLELREKEDGFSLLDEDLQPVVPQVDTVLLSAIKSIERAGDNLVVKFNVSQVNIPQEILIVYNSIKILEKKIK